MGIGSGKSFQPYFYGYCQLLWVPRLVCWVFTAVVLSRLFKRMRLLIKVIVVVLFVNTKGELVGINAVLSSPTGAYAGYGFAIPSSIMTKVVSDLKQYGTVQRALFGIKGRSLERWTIKDEATKKAKELGVVDGVFVAEVVEGGSAAGAGIKVDDVIIGIDGHKVRNMAELQGELAKHRPGDKVSVKVIREKKEKQSWLHWKMSKELRK